jgi:hypothetical protein
MISNPTGWRILSSGILPLATNVKDLTNLPRWEDFIIRIIGMTHNGGAARAIAIFPSVDNGASFDSVGANFTGGGNGLIGGAIPNLNAGTLCNVYTRIYLGRGYGCQANSQHQRLDTSAIITSPTNYTSTADAFKRINGFRITILGGAGNFTAGTYELHGRR